MDNPLVPGMEGCMPATKATRHVDRQAISIKNQVHLADYKPTGALTLGASIAGGALEL
jgi:hypothetical protein